MPAIWRKYLVNVVLLLSAGALIGALYGHAERGLLVAVTVALAWQIRKLLLFERALQSQNFDTFRDGEGIWQHIYSRYRHQVQRAGKYKARYQQLLKEVRKSTNAMPDGGIVLNSGFEILVCNRAAQDLLGFKRKKDRGQRVDNLLRDPAFSRYLADGDYSGGVDIASPVKPDGWLYCRLVPYGANQFLLLVRDISERHRLTIMRRDFVANASHELRSPLTVISGYLDALMDDPDLSEDWRKPVEQMRSQANRMNTIVSELLELSRLEGSASDREEHAVNVGAILASTKKSYAGLADSPEILVQVQTSAKILGNDEEMESVVSNLVSNAVRHTAADGTVTLVWRGDRESAELVVSDTGCGIAEEHIPRLTERFFRVDSGRSREGGGIGLGLAIVKHALLRHDALLNIESKLGEGSTFTCTFPASRLIFDAPKPIRQAAT